MEGLEDRPDIEQRVKETQEQASRPLAKTFESVARQVFEVLGLGFKNAKHRAQWLSTLEAYVFPVIGEMPVARLRTADSARALGPIWTEKPETASRVKQRCDQIMTYCIAHLWVDTNPVSAVDALLPKPP